MRPKRKPVVLTDVDHGHLEQIKAVSAHQHALLIEVAKPEPWTYETLAAQFQVPIGTVKSRLSRARDKLNYLRKSAESQVTA